MSTNKEAGLLDVLLLPQTGEYKLALIECKVAKSSDSKCIGQLLKYYAFALQIGADGLRRLSDYAADYPEAACGWEKTTPKKFLGVPSEKGQTALSEGTLLQPSEIALFIATNGPGHRTLQPVTSMLAGRFGLRIGIAVVDDEGGITVAPTTA